MRGNELRDMRLGRCGRANFEIYVTSVEAVTAYAVVTA